MSNGYLKRVPTSTGNRKTLTISAWFKANNAAGGGGHTIFSSGTNQTSPSDKRNGIDLVMNGNPMWQFEQYGFPDGTLRNYYSRDISRRERDFSSWSHIMVSYDSTSTLQQDRAELYINGTRVDTDGSTNTFPLDHELPIGVLTNNLGIFIGKGCGAMQYNDKYFYGSLFDYFFVDGLALTPDNFGFYKNGDGYISAGSSKSTKFKSGQWTPKSPKIIKSVINSLGGFGANGFYLPMNDSDNFGADFHCKYDTIIKLKGEDDPQPVSGAPTTSDNYVSQLREDPYSDNLVLAVPGLGLENTNPELVTNGNFTNGTTGWNGLSGGSLSIENDKLKITETTGALDAYAVNSTTITTEIGKRYTIKWTFTKGTNTSFTVRFGSSGDQSLNILTNSDDDAQFSNDGTYCFDFEATGTQLNLSFIVNQASSYGYLSNVSVKEAIPVRDYSADIKGSGTNKTLTPYGGAGTAHGIQGHYGSAMSVKNTSDHGFHVGWGDGDPDFDFGDDDWTVEMWFKKTIDEGGYYSILRSKNYHENKGSGLALYGYANGFRIWQMENATSGATNVHGASTTTVGFAPLDQWTHFAVVKHNEKISTFCNGHCTITSENTFSHSNDGFEIGMTYPWQGLINDLRIYKGVAKYTGSFDTPKPFTPIGMKDFRTTADTCKNNFCNLNTLDTSQLIPTNNLSIDQSSGGWHSLLGTHYVRSGKWYAEMRIDRLGWIMFGIDQTWLETRTRHIGGQTGSKGVALVYNTGNRGDITYNGTNSVYTGADATAATGDIISIALDLDSKSVKFYKNNVLQYDLSNILESEADYAFGVSLYSNVAATVNFGQNPSFSGTVAAGTNADDSGKGLFKYAPPSGYLALCEDNLPTPTIADPGKHFKCALYTGDGRNGHSITGVGFKPDLVWLKERTSTSSHQLHDSVRGAGNVLFSNATNVESYSSTYLYSLDSDGFTLGTSGGVNANADDYVAWCWKAGGDAVTNTSGDIDSVVSVNQDAGFSIVSYDGSSNINDTVGHGLEKTPSFIILKVRTQGYYWRVYHSHYGTSPTQGLLLGDSPTAQTGSFNHDEHGGVGSVSTSTFGFGTNGTNTLSGVNKSGDKYIAYCWAEIEGYSKFGSYIGNGNADGPFIYCGFKPALVMYKRIDTTGDWAICDSSRNSTNPLTLRLFANNSNQDTTGVDPFDFVSNGFKFRTNAGSANGDGATYIFMAFAESPFQTANAK